MEDYIKVVGSYGGENSKLPKICRQYLGSLQMLCSRRMEKISQTG